MDPEDEISFLALHHLQQNDTNPDAAKALDMLESTLTDLPKLSAAIDYTGAQHALTYVQFFQCFRHVLRLHSYNLLRACERTFHKFSSRWSPSFHPSSNLSNHPRHFRIECTKWRLISALNNNATAHVYHYSCIWISFPLQPLTLCLLPSPVRWINRYIGHHFIVFPTISDFSS